MNCILHLGEEARQRNWCSAHTSIARAKSQSAPRHIPYTVSHLPHILPQIWQCSVILHCALCMHVSWTILIPSCLTITPAYYPPPSQRGVRYQLTRLCHLSQWANIGKTFYLIYRNMTTNAVATMSLSTATIMPWQSQCQWHQHGRITLHNLQPQPYHKGQTSIGAVC